jgi:hypothetical protein
MGSSQSRSTESKRYSRVAIGDQLKSVLRRPSPSTQENNGDVEKPHSADVTEQEVTNSNHDEISTPETERKMASTAVRVLYVFCGCALVNLLSATTTCLHASHCSLSSNTHLSLVTFV